MFLIRTGARPIDADASLQELGGGGKISGNIRKNGHVEGGEILLSYDWKSLSSRRIVHTIKILSLRDCIFQKKLENKETRKFTLN